MDYSVLLAASLSYLMLKQQDAVGMTLFDNQIRKYIPPKSKRTHLNILLSQLEKITTSNNTKISPILHQTAEIIKKRGLIILISDLFDSQEKILSGLKHFRYKGHEVLVFHILDEQEIKLDFSKVTRFKDLESDEEIITEPLHIKSDYQKNINEFCENYKYQCRKNKIDYIKLTTDTPLELALSEYLLKRKLIL